MVETDSSHPPARHPSVSTTMTASSEAGPSTPTFPHRPDAVVRDPSTTPSPSSDERFMRGPPTPGVRLSRMMLGKPGTLPPPPGPPPLGPPPMPPLSTHPFAQPHIPGPGSRTSSLPLAAQQQPRTTSILHNPSRPPPTAPPPTSALPRVPSGSGYSHRRQVSMTSSTSSHDSGSRRRSTKAKKSPSLNGPPSPSMSSASGHAPPISPRTTSLMSVQQQQQQSPEVVGSTSTIHASHSQTSLAPPNATVPDAKRPPGKQRTPSRHLLQSALDLAQRAVEMDKSNDVEGSLAAYREAVARLRSVMERVGVKPPGADGKQRIASGKSEEEGRTLRGIHDAYVARIELLSSYPNANGRPVSGSSSDPRPAHTGGGDVTPTRSSLDETAHVGIGNFMLADSVISPERSQAAPGPSTPSRHREAPPSPTPPTRALPSHPSPTPKGLNITLPSSGGGSTLQQALDDAADSARSSPTGTSKRVQSQLGLGHPSTSPRTVIEDSAAASSPANLTPSKKREMLRAKMAAGRIESLESTLDEDGLMESASAASIGHSRQSSIASAATGLHSMSPRVPPPSEAEPRRSEDKGLPPLPPSAPLAAVPAAMTSPRQSSLGALMHPRADGLLVSPSTHSGKIAQRRASRHANQASISSMTEVGSPPDSAVSPTANTTTTANGRPLATASSPSQLTPTFRTRAKSQPGTRPDLFHNASESRQPLPPLPTLPHKTSAQFVSKESNGLAPPHAIGSASSPHSIARSTSSSLISPVPEPQPSELVHRPFHLLRLLHTSMDPHGSGAYLTGAIHISPHVWQASLHHRAGPGGKKDTPLRLVAQDTKVRCMEALIINLEIVRATGIPLLDGPRELKYGAPLTHVPHPRGGETVVKMAEEFSNALDGLEEEMDQTYKSMIKAGVAVNSWKGKKSGSNAKSWGSRFTRSMDKITHTKAIDSTDKYVELLSHFLATIQAIDDHLCNFTGACTPAYHYLPPRARQAIETRILRAAEFTSAVVVPFVLDDFKQFFSRYLKGGVRYLED